MIFQSNATDSEPSSHVRQLIFHTCQANQQWGEEGLALRRGCCTGGAAACNTEDQKSFTWLYNGQ